MEEKPKPAPRSKTYRSIHPTRIFFDGFTMSCGDVRKLTRKQAEGHLKHLEEVK